MNLQPEVLENAFVRLEPLSEAHKEGLRAACAADPEIWLKLYPFSMLDEHFEPAWRRMLEGRLQGQSQTYAVLHEGRCVGMTSFIDIEPRWGTVEIGGTYYEPRVRGGAVNPAAKRLMMGHAFDGGAGRVQLKVDALNARSRAAVLKLGAVQEGILRRDRVTWTGRLRDTVVFSVLDQEWPAVRAGLDARLAAFAQEPAGA
jgi:RimJ/RimL family protein N-acetyltransferase